MHHDFEVQPAVTMRRWRSQINEFRKKKLCELEIKAQEELIDNLLQRNSNVEHKEQQEWVLSYAGHEDDYYLKTLARQLAVMAPSDIHIFLDYQYVKFRNDKKLATSFVIELSNFVIKYIKQFPSKNLNARLNRIDTWNPQKKTAAEWAQIAAYYQTKFFLEETTHSGIIDARELQKKVHKLGLLNQFLDLLTKKEKGTAEPALHPSEHARLVKIFGQKEGIIHPKSMVRVKINLGPDELSVFLRLMWEMFYQPYLPGNDKMKWSRLCSFALAIFDVNYDGKPESFARRGQRLLVHFDDIEEKNNPRLYGGIPANIALWLKWRKDNLGNAKKDEKTNKASTAESDSAGLIQRKGKVDL